MTIRLKSSLRMRLRLILSTVVGTMSIMATAAPVASNTAAQAQEPKSARTRPSAASAPASASKGYAKKPMAQRSVPAANTNASPFPVKAPPLGLCDGS